MNNQIGGKRIKDAKLRNFLVKVSSSIMLTEDDLDIVVSILSTLSKQEKKDILNQMLNCAKDRVSKDRISNRIALIELDGRTSWPIALCEECAKIGVSRLAEVRQTHLNRHVVNACQQHRLSDLILRNYADNDVPISIYIYPTGC